jgi:hypothetical protein
MALVATPARSLLLPLFVRSSDETPACTNPDYDPEWWHPPGPGQFALNGNAARARAICWGCPLRIPCGEHAIVRGEHGVWGAMTPSEIEGERRCRRGTCTHPEHRRSQS